MNQGKQGKADAAHNAVIVEGIATMASQTLAANLKVRPIAKALHEEHFFHKHGSSACYGGK